MAPVLTTEWFSLKDSHPNDDECVMVYWEDNGECFLDSGLTPSNGKLLDEEYNEVRFPAHVNVIWSYFPNPTAESAKLAGPVQRPVLVGERYSTGGCCEDSPLDRLQPMPDPFK